MYKNISTSIENDTLIEKITELTYLRNNKFIELNNNLLKNRSIKIYIVLLYYLYFVVVLTVKNFDRNILIKNDVHMWKYIRYTVYLCPRIYMFIYFIILCFSKIETTKTVFIFRFV